MFYKDTAGKMDVADPTAVVANANLGLKERYVFSRETGILEMVGPLFCDVFRSERLLVSFIDLKVILNCNVNEFCLMASEDDVDYRVKLTEAYFKILPIAHFHRSRIVNEKRTGHLSRETRGVQKFYHCGRKSVVKKR